MNEKNHWYDGHIYDKVIAPNQDRMFNIIKTLLPKNCTVLDVGCGTGRLSFQFVDHCKKVVGIDLSSKNIEIAKTKLSKMSHPNLSFIHSNGSTFSGDTQFDYAILTYVVHEMPELERLQLLSQLKAKAKNIIIGDYLTPTPKSFWGGLNVIVEYLAGKDHYKNFKNYVKNGGLHYLAEKSSLKIIRDIKNQPKTSHIILFSQN